MHHTLSVTRHEDGLSLRTQATLVFAAPGITQFEERFSSNYPPDDHYFLGFAVNASVMVCDADEGAAADFPYWVIIQSPVSWGNSVAAMSTDPTDVAATLRRAGMQSTVT